MLTFKNFQIWKWHRRIACSCSAVTIPSLKRRGSQELCRGCYFLRQSFRRFKSQLKRAMRWQRSTIRRYSYDPKSYSQNFDDGGSSLKNLCESWRMNVELNNIRGFSVVPQECTQFIGKYMTSTQYKADLERAVEEITVYLSSCCHLKGDGKDAWIFDVDDTLLSTVPYFKAHNFGGDKINMSSLEGWMRGSKAPAVEHVVRLFHQIKDSGVKIFLISTRRETLRDSTVDNLIGTGYHGWSGLILRGLEDECKEVQNYKAEARKRLVDDEGYRLWGIVGDQWSSFEGHTVPKRTFKLPNSMYYVS